MMKPGYRTTEFWFTLVSFIFSGLYLTGVIHDHNQKEELISNVTHAVESSILIGGQIAILYKYLKSRKTEKIEYEKTKQKEADNQNKELEEYIGVDKTLHLININNANIGELVQLPHIGVVLAKKIIDHRTNVGGFKNLEDIMEVTGINNDKYQDIKKYIILETLSPKRTKNDKPQRTTKARNRKSNKPK